VADARVHNTSIHFELAADLPPVFIHRTQITQALLNLIRNALESPAGAPAERQIVVRSQRTATGDCEVAVRDNGAGVAPEIIDRMFEPFRTTKNKGTGLGLPMSRTIAEAHDGTLRHEPVQPHGACFTLTLPAAETAA
jgi:signal transduction histidine kinase